MSIQFKPLLAWPRAHTKTRKGGRFDSTYAQTLDLLERELVAISARHAVIQMAITAGDIRRDGFPRATARPSHPGIIVSFELQTHQNNVWTTQATSMPCDTFHNWQDNLRGIALSLEALRKIDRYGVTQTGEQYRGFAALPPATNTDFERDFASELEAAVWLNGVVKMEMDVDLMGNKSARKKAYQIAARILHPDSKDGNAAGFRLLQKAKTTLEID